MNDHLERDARLAEIKWDLEAAIRRAIPKLEALGLTTDQIAEYLRAAVAESDALADVTLEDLE